MMVPNQKKDVSVFAVLRIVITSFLVVSKGTATEALPPLHK